MQAGFRQFLRFCIVGGIGFLTDAGALEMLVHQGMEAPIARLFSIALALQITYVLHGAFTFRLHRGYSVRSWASFIGLNLIGAGVNYVVFLCVLPLAWTGDALLDRQSALLTGTVAGLLCNYWTNRRFVFKPKGSAA